MAYGMWEGTSARPLPPQQDNGAMGAPPTGGGGPAGPPQQARGQGTGTPVNVYGIANSLMSHGAQANAQAAPAQLGGGGVSPSGAAAQIAPDNSIQKDAAQQNATANNAGTIAKIVQMIYGGGGGYMSGAGGA